MPRHKSVPDSTILDAARSAFAQHGHSASTRLIAQMAGLSQATLFQRFGDKSALFRAATLPVALPIDRILGPLPKQFTPGSNAHLSAIALRLHTHLVEALPNALLLAQQAENEPDPLSRSALTSALEIRIAAMQQGGALPSAPAAALLADAIVVQVHGLALLSRLRPDPALPAAIHRFLRTLLAAR